MSMYRPDKCAKCGTKMPKPEEAVVHGIPAARAGGLDMGMFVPVYVAACPNCGFIELCGIPHK